MVSIRFLTVMGLSFCVFIPGTGITENRMEACKTEAIEWIDGNSKIIEDAAIAIHSFAEIGLREYKSSEYLADMLEKNGFTVERHVADMPTAFVASYGSGRPVIGILAEYDALPGLSQKPGIPHKEAIKPGEPGHGCGHNLFGAGSAEAAMAMKAVIEKHNLPGTVKLFGCPAEETLVGKVYMAKEGIFNSIDACFNWHPGTENRVLLGSSRAMNSFEIAFHGKTAHGASDPWNGRSALDAVELMDIGVNFLREHVEEPVRIHYVIPDGGKAPNVVPDYARVWYFVRAADRDGVEEVYNRVLKCAEGATLMTDTTMELNFITGVYNYLPNRVLSEVVYRNFSEIGPPQFTDKEQAFAREMQKNLGIPEEGLSTVIEAFEEPKKLTGGSTDVADVSWIVPSARGVTIVTAPVGIPWHSWAVVSCSATSIGFKGMHVVAKILAAAGIEVILDPDIVSKAREEFKEKTKGFIYKSAVPLEQKPPVPERE